MRADANAIDSMDLARPAGRVRPMIVAAILLTTLVAGCPFDSAETRLARGKDLAAKNDHNGAIIEFKNVLQSNPKSVEARFLLGREFLAQGNPRAAEIELQKADDAKYAPDDVVPLIARAQYQQGKTDEIAAEVKRQRLASPEANAALQTTYGLSLQNRRKFDEALAAFAAAQGLVPGYPDALVGDARIKAMRNDLDGASAELAQVLAKDPALIEALLLKGDIVRTRGDLKGATEIFLDATNRAPKNLAARLALAGAYVAANDFDSAAAQVAELKKLAPNHPGVQYQDALRLYNKKDYLRANDAVLASLNGAPDNGNAQILAGAIALAINQPEQAASHLQEGVRLVPNSVFARFELVRLYLLRREPLKAGEVLRPMLGAMSDNPAVLGLAGQVALQLGKFSEASKYLGRATTLDPTNSAMRAQAAMANFAGGDDAQGFALLEAPTEKGTNEALATTTLLLVRLEHRQYDQAATTWKTLQTQRPNDPVTYNLLAAIEVGRNDLPAARKALERALELQPTYFVAVSNLASLDEKAGDLDAARNRYKTFLTKDKNSAPAMIALATLDAKHGGKPETILPLLTAARRASPTADQPVAVLAEYYLSQDQLPQALAVAQEALAQSPDNAAFLALTGELQLRSGGIDQALAVYRKLVAARPASVEAQVGLGRALVAANQTDAALQLFTALVKANPGVASIQTIGVDALLGVARIDQANRLIAEIQKVAPKSPALPEAEGDVRVVAGQPSDAATIYRRGLAQNPSPVLVIKLSSALRTAGNQAASSSVLGDWLKAHPDDTLVRIHDADVALIAADYPRAVAGYRRVLAASPDNPTILNNLGWALWQQKDPSAVTTVKRAIEIAPNSAAANDTMGSILVDQGSVSDGIEFLRKANTASPKSGPIALHLAKAQIKDGRKDDARATLQALLKVAPNSPQGSESKALIASLR